MSYQREPSGDTVRWSRRVIGDHRLRFTGCSGYIAENGRQRGSGSWIAVPNFVDIENFTFVAQVPDDAPLVYLSRLERAKGAHSAIAIAKGAGRRLVIAGNRVNSDEGRHYWKHEIEHEIGRNGIEYIGPVDDVQKNQLLGSASAMVVPIEWNEPFGIVFAESLACGTPVISSPRGAVPSIVLHDTHGYLVRSIEEGIDGVRRLHTISRAACRQQAEASFNVVSVAQDYLNLYQTAMLS